MTDTMYPEQCTQCDHPTGHFRPEAAQWGICSNCANLPSDERWAQDNLPGANQDEDEVEDDRYACDVCARTAFTGTLTAWCDTNDYPTDAAGVDFAFEIGNVMATCDNCGHRVDPRIIDADWI